MLKCFEQMLKKIMFIAVLLTLVQSNVYAQEHVYTNLSNKYIFKVKITWFKDTDGISRSSDFKLAIVNKLTRKTQTINFKPGLLFSGVFRKGNDSRSYTTGFNISKNVADYDFGDIVIADLNFDGEEDLAVKFDSGGNGGPLYNFYLQDKNGYFKIDHFLTDTMLSFPQYIDKTHKILTTKIHANVHQENEASFKYNPNSKKWKFLKSVLVDY